MQPSIWLCHVFIQYALYMHAISKYLLSCVSKAHCRKLISTRENTEIIFGEMNAIEVNSLWEVTNNIPKLHFNNHMTPSLIPSWRARVVWNLESWPFFWKLDWKKKEYLKRKVRIFLDQKPSFAYRKTKIPEYFFEALFLVWS